MVESLDEFRRQVVACSLLLEEEVRSISDALPVEQRPKDGASLARLLVEQGKLTAFQVETIRGQGGNTLVLGNYVLLDQLGQGGMGTVYKAEHRRMQRLVALKVLSANVVKSPELQERFQREARAAARLEHPNIVTAYDADEFEGTHFLVMQYVDGQDLAAYVKRHGPLSVKQAVDCIVQAARGLQYAHDQGVVHRDIKPANLLLDKAGVVKILDMGLARIDSTQEKESDLTSTGAVMGTVDYMSPEQAVATKNADARSDQYSLGLTLWYLLTGRSAYGGESLMAKLLAHRDAPIPSLAINRPDVPPMLEVVFQKMVAKQPGNRFATLSEAADALDRSLAGSALEFEALSTGQTSDNQNQKFLQAGDAAAWRVASGSNLALAENLVESRHEDTFLSEATDTHFTLPRSPSTNAGKSPARWTRRILPWSVIGGIVLPLVLAMSWGNRPSSPGVGADLSPPPPPVSRAWQPTPEQQAFFDDVAKLPLDDRFRAVREKLREINPEYDGKGTVRHEEGKIIVCDLPGAGISDLWPVRALPDLTTLLCRGVVGKPSTLADLSPLRGMPLIQLSIQLTSVSDLSPLAGMPLERLECFSTRVTDLSPLAGMPLSYLNVSNTAVHDLAPLAGAPLTHFSCPNTRVTDLSPLVGMPLTVFSCNISRVTDLSPLRGAPLIRLSCDDAIIRPHCNFLQGMPTLETINGRPAKEVLAESLWQLTPEQEAFFDEVAKLPPNEQVQAVARKLQEINPGFDGAVRYQSPEGRAVTTLTLSTVEVAHIWPVRALSELTSLNCSGTKETRGKLRDLSQMAGLKLKSLICSSTEVADLSPLSGMPLNYLVCDRTKIADLSPLRGMPLTYLVCGFNAGISDLSALRGMPLTHLGCDYTNISDLDPLAGMKLVHLNVSQTKVSDLSVVAGMPITELHCYVTMVDDLSPLKGAALTILSANGTRIADLSVLRGMPLAQVHVLATRVTDLSPLQGMPLKDFAGSDDLIRAHRDFLSAIPTLETINNQPATEVLAR